ncbi:uncharacterized protein [Diadema antillarum]|uniref:uncharacterized protein n=1 Tax=Diadema antillarum TaxID=105358 RepID=UPI003A8A1CC2
MVIRTFRSLSPWRWILCAAIVWLAGGTITATDGYPTGAPLEACQDMVPLHGGSPQDNLALLGVNITTSVLINTQGATLVQVLLEGTENNLFRGFFIQARQVGGDGPVGRFLRIPTGQVGVACGGDSDSAVTHSERSLKLGAAFVWRTSKKEDATDLYFRATIVKSYDEYWTNLYSDVLFPSERTTPPGKGAGEGNATSTEGNSTTTEPPLPTTSEAEAPQTTSDGATLESVRTTEGNLTPTVPSNVFSTQPTPSTTGRAMTTSTHESNFTTGFTGGYNSSTTFSTTLLQSQNSTSEPVATISDNSDGNNVSTTDGNVTSLINSTSFVTTTMSTTAAISTSQTPVNVTTDDISITSNQTFDNVTSSTTMPLFTTAANITTTPATYNYTTEFPFNVTTTSATPNITMNHTYQTTASSNTTLNISDTTPNTTVSYTNQTTEASTETPNATLNYTHQTTTVGVTTGNSALNYTNQTQESSTKAPNASTTTSTETLNATQNYTYQTTTVGITTPNTTVNYTYLTTESNTTTPNTTTNSTLASSTISATTLQTTMSDTVQTTLMRTTSSPTTLGSTSHTTIASTTSETTESYTHGTTDESMGGVTTKYISTGRTTMPSLRPNATLAPENITTVANATMLTSNSTSSVVTTTPLPVTNTTTPNVAENSTQGMVNLTTSVRTNNITDNDNVTSTPSLLPTSPVMSPIITSPETSTATTQTTFVSTTRSASTTRSVPSTTAVGSTSDPTLFTSEPTGPTNASSALTNMTTSPGDMNTTLNYNDSTITNSSTHAFVNVTTATTAPAPTSTVGTTLATNASSTTTSISANESSLSTSPSLYSTLDSFTTNYQSLNSTTEMTQDPSNVSSETEPSNSSIVNDTTTTSAPSTPGGSNATSFLSTNSTTDDGTNTTATALPTFEQSASTSEESESTLLTALSTTLRATVDTTATQQALFTEGANDVLLRFRITGRQFTDALTRSDSPEFVALETEVVEVMNDVYEGNDDLRAIDVIRFLQGSVIPEVKLVFGTSLDESSKLGVVDVLYNAVEQAGGQLGNFSVDNMAALDDSGQFTVVDVCYLLPCPVGVVCDPSPVDNRCYVTCEDNRNYCYNGGECVEPTGDETIATCSCPENFNGERCETEIEVPTMGTPTNDGNSQTMLIIILASVCGVLGVLFVILFGVLIYWCKSLNKSQHIMENSEEIAKWRNRRRRGTYSSDGESGDEPRMAETVVGTSYTTVGEAKPPRSFIVIPDDNSSGSMFYITDSDSDSEHLIRPKLIEGGASFPFYDNFNGSIPDLLTSAADYEMDVMQRMSNQPLTDSVRRRSVSFSDIQQVISDDDRIGWENFTFGSNTKDGENNNFQVRWDFKVEDSGDGTDEAAIEGGDDGDDDADETAA